MNPLKKLNLLRTISVFYLLRLSLDHISLPSKHFDSEYDFVVIGGGSAGSVVASRLSEDPSVSVLLLEAGPPETIFSDIPSTYALLLGSPLDWFFKTEPQVNSFFNMYDQRSSVSRGKTLGGTSTINGMIYFRGNPKDYDDWEALGAKGWSWEDVFPFFLKSERNTNKQFLANGFHGDSGPLWVTSSHRDHIGSRHFITAAKKLGFDEIDLNGPRKVGCAFYQQHIVRGTRVSMSRAFLEPVRHRPNLHVLSFTFVLKILFDGNIAYGVAFEKLGKHHIVLASREVILCAGAIQSPQMLMVSGVGPRKMLESLGIEVVADRPGVGENLQNHVHVITTAISEPKRNFFLASPLSPLSILRYLISLSGPSGSLDQPAIHLPSKYYKDKSAAYLQVALLQNSFSIDPTGTVARHYVNMRKDAFLKYFGPYIGKSAFMLTATILQPKSRGRIWITSPDAKQHPSIDPRYLSHPLDIKMLVEAQRWVWKVALSKTFKANGLIPYLVPVPGCERWFNVKKLLLRVIPDVRYLYCVARHMIFSACHYAGTCRMGAAEDRLAVVDPKLKVIGVKRLRVIDSSVFPLIIRGNTNAPTVMIGEKGTQMIKDEHGLL